jgi:hypothetical protein
VAAITAATAQPAPASAPDVRPGGVLCTTFDAQSGRRAASRTTTTTAAPRIARRAGGDPRGERR